MRALRFATACAVALAIQAQDAPVEKLAPYYPTPEAIVEKMLRLGGLKAGEKMFDLGSGDGRIVIMAARDFKADATGVEFDDSLCLRSLNRDSKPGFDFHGAHRSRRFDEAGLFVRRSAYRVSASYFQRQSEPDARKAIEEGRARRGARFRVLQVDSGEDGADRRRRGARPQLVPVPALTAHK